MRKIPTVFLRDPDDPAHLLNEWHPDCLWVRDGEGVATRKYDGTCVMLDADDKWWTRREVKPGKTPPPYFLAVEHDETTGKTVGWEPAEQSAFYRWMLEAIHGLEDNPAPGTFELLGPKINGNPEGEPVHLLRRHADAERVRDSARDLIYATPSDEDFDAFAAISWLAVELAKEGWEGIVWHHPDGRMAKIKARDFQ